jgi:hypothetical protein
MDALVRGLAAELGREEFTISTVDMMAEDSYDIRYESLDRSDKVVITVKERT